MADAFFQCREHNKLADKLSNQAVDTSGWQGLKDTEVGFVGFAHVLPTLESCLKVTQLKQSFNA